LLHALNLSIEPGKEKNINDLVKLKEVLYEQFWSVYSLKELNFWFYDLELFRRYEKIVILKYIDLYWSRHLENMKFLKDAVTWEAYAQKDPFIQYEEQGSILFYNTFKQCRDAIIYDLLSIEII
jgi:preprotein translocase subunit SecA